MNIYSLIYFILFYFLQQISGRLRRNVLDKSQSGKKYWTTLSPVDEISLSGGFPVVTRRLHKQIYMAVWAPGLYSQSEPCATILYRLCSRLEGFLSHLGTSESSHTLEGQRTPWLDNEFYFCKRCQGGLLLFIMADNQMFPYLQL